MLFEVYEKDGYSFEIIISYSADTYTINVFDNTHTKVWTAYFQNTIEMPAEMLSDMARTSADSLLESKPWVVDGIEELTDKWSKGEIKGDPYLTEEQKNYIRGAYLYGSHCKSCGNDEECDCFERDENDMGVDTDTWQSLKMMFEQREHKGAVELCRSIHQADHDSAGLQADHAGGSEAKCGPH